MSDQQIALESIPRMQEEDWDLLISTIKQREVIPVIGPDLIRVSLGDESVTYERYVAHQLAQKPEYRLTDGDLSPLGVTVEQATLNDVMSVCVKKRPDQWPIELHSKVWQIVNEAQLLATPALTQLAQISHFDLFVTSTFDPLLERVLGTAGTLETRVYRGSALDDIGDLQKARRDGRRFLYYLFGRAERGKYDFAICEVEILRFLIKLHDARYRPKRLFDELRDKHLLLLGVNFSDWLARFFLWLAKGRGNVSLPNRELREYLADPKVGKDRSLVLFLEHFSDTTRVVGIEPDEFVAELHRRWSEEASSTVQPGSQPPTEMPKGAIFLSYSRTDRASVEALYAKLNRESIPVWYDAGLQAGDVWKEKIRKYIDSCSVFIPLVSMEALRRERAEFREEWQQAVEIDKQYFGSAKSPIVPIVVDDVDDILRAPQSFGGLPKEFVEAQMYFCPRGSAGQNLIDCLRGLLQKAVGSER
jgi:TIR domain